ncbi:DUF4391 domain-containing protein [Burkholderia pseudomallei]|uniref:DUF4391 domain-containing protein n=1 Tax=Burkholderia pseudomallei TaxID=28450 RepID=UPI001FB8E708|nr:DUF4391 domain-containing protein [Burkholderia pseudomallei]MDI6017881.1 DUF4391 domain-containing protein [Burkholderia pseudomallei]
MTVNLLKRLESSVESFRLTLQSLRANNETTLAKIAAFNYVKAHGDLSNMPNGMHAVVAARPEMGLRPGAIFTLRNRNSGVNVNQHNRLHPYYLVYINREGEVEKTSSKLAKEKQFNRKVEINATLRQLKTELEQLSR